MEEFYYNLKNVQDLYKPVWDTYTPVGLKGFSLKTYINTLTLHKYPKPLVTLSIVIKTPDQSTLWPILGLRNLIGLIQTPVMLNQHTKHWAKRTINIILESYSKGQECIRLSKYIICDTTEHVDPGLMLLYHPLLKDTSRKLILDYLYHLKTGYERMLLEIALIEGMAKINNIKRGVL